MKYKYKEKKMKRNFFKSKTARLLLASLVIIPTAFLVTACGGKSEPEKLDRTNNVKVVNILQDYQGSVLMEIENFYHEGYEVASDEGITSSSLEFSINGSEWARGEYITDFYDQYNKAIYQIMYYDYSSDDFKMSYLGGDDSFAVGQTVNISVRIPESDTYKASEGKNVGPFTLKNVPSNISDSFDSFVDTTPDNIATSDGESSEFTFYVDGSTLKVGRYQTSARDDGWFDKTLIKFEDLTEQDKTELDALNLEFKLVDYNSTFVNETPIEGTNYVSEEIGDVASVENYFPTVSSREWTSLKQIEYAVNTNVADYKIWDLNSYVNDGFGGYEIQNNKYLVLLVRQGETQSTGVSRVLQINYNFSYTSSLLDTSGDYVKLEMITTDDGTMPEVTSTTQAMTDWMGTDVYQTAVDGYSGVIKIDYSDATGDYKIQGTVENKYTDTSLQIFTTNTELSDLINSGYYTIEGTVDTDTTQGNENTTNLTIKDLQGQELKHIFNSNVDTFIFKALQIDVVTNMVFSGDIQYFECVDGNYLKLKMTFDDGEAYYIFDSNGNFVGHKITTSIGEQSYSVEFKIN